jgi:glycerol kinase
VRAALESIAYQIRDVLDMMHREAGLELASLQADGGPTANRFLMQFTADLTGVELHVGAVAESSPRGAALAGLLGLGIIRSLDEIAAAPREEAVFRPVMPPEEVQRLFAGWQHAVRQVLVPKTHA